MEENEEVKELLTAARDLVRAIDENPKRHYWMTVDEGNTLARLRRAIETADARAHQP